MTRADSANEERHDHRPDNTSCRQETARRSGHVALPTFPFHVDPASDNPMPQSRAAPHGPPQPQILTQSARRFKEVRAGSRENRDGVPLGLEDGLLDVAEVFAVDVQR